MIAKAWAVAKYCRLPLSDHSRHFVWTTDLLMLTPHETFGPDGLSYLHGIEFRSTREFERKRSMAEERVQRRLAAILKTLNALGILLRADKVIE